jgi:hypothetical protein
MGETRVDLLHLLEDLRDAYQGSLEETILTEIVARHDTAGSRRSGPASRKAVRSGRVSSMRPEDVRAFVERDWRALANAKADAWLEQRRLRGVEGACEIADELRRRVLAIKREWPSAEEREEDLATHLRVAELLRRAGRR